MSKNCSSIASASPWQFFLCFFLHILRSIVVDLLKKIIQFDFFPQTVTLSYINEEKFTIDWVYNILEHKKESERIVYEDLDPETGFVLLPDFKWSCKQIEDLYLLAIVQRRNLKSIRDLNHRHLPLLEKLWKDGTRAIQGILT